MVIDSEAGSAGQGQLVVLAARLVQAGISFEDIVNIIESAKKQLESAIPPQKAWQSSKERSILSFHLF